MFGKLTALAIVGFTVVSAEGGFFRLLNNENLATSNLDSGVVMAQFQSFASNLAGGLSLANGFKSKNDVCSQIKKLDKDNDGKLSKKEVKDAAAAAGQPLTDAEIDQGFLMMDTNKDGLLDEQEIWDFVNKPGM